MQNIYKIMLITLAFIVFISFFMPWLKIEPPVVDRISKIIKAKTQASISGISGFDVPIMANGRDAHFMLAVIKVFNPSIKDADKKSWFIWGVPIFGVTLVFICIFFGRLKWLCAAIAVICAAIFVAAVFKIKTTDLHKLILNAKIGHGLWLTLWGYFGIGIVNVLNLIGPVDKK